MNIPRKAEIHLIEHYWSRYWGSASFLMDIAAELANPERIVLFAHEDISPGEFADGMKQRFIRMEKDCDHIGRVLGISIDGVEEQLSKQEYGLYPGMEMILVTTGAGLSGALKYLYNTIPDVMKWISVVVSIQCGYKRTFLDTIDKDYGIRGCLRNKHLNTYFHEEGEEPKDLDKKSIQFENGSVGTIIDNRFYATQILYNKPLAKC